MANTQTHLVAVFDSFETARKAQDELVKEGFSREDVQITGNERPRVQTASSGSSYSSDTHEESGISGFFHRIFGSDTDDEDRGHFEGAMTRGSAVLTVDADPEDIDAAAEILNSYNPINLDENGTASASSGFTGGTAAGREKTNSAERVIPVVQEDMQVGKRTITRGGVRVYTRVTEQPVEENVSLREEHARVERRPANREATDADFKMKDEVVEVIETGEEAVVGKTARVVEEVVVGKDTTNRTETVRDTVRRTDVQVENISPETMQDFQNDYKTKYSSQPGADYNNYGPAYEYGYRMANDSRYKGRHWSDIEQSLKNDYSSSNSGSTWDQVSGAVRHGWDKVTGARSNSSITNTGATTSASGSN